MTMTLEKPSTLLDAIKIKEQIFTEYPSMARSKKIKLCTQLIPSFLKAVDAASMLGREELSFPEALNCDVADDYMILRDDEDESIADVYIGADKRLNGHVVFSDGEEIDEHNLLILQGHTLANDFLWDCGCKKCESLRAKHIVEHESDHLVRNSNHVLSVHVPRDLKIKDTSDRLLDAMRGSSVDKLNTSRPKITSTNPMKRDGSISYYTNEQ